MLKRLSSIAVLFVITAITASSALAASGPVGVWKLDEGSGTTVYDSSGNGNNGVLSGGVSWVPGVSGSALSFDGVSGQVKVADNNALEPGSAVTVSAWLKHAGSPGAFRYIMAKGANGCIAASYGLYSGPGGGLQFYVSQHHASVYARSPDAGQKAWDGRWHLAVGTYDGSTIRLYVDGVQVGSGTSWEGSLEYLLPSSNDFYIGNYPSCSPHGFPGSVDDVTVWGRALSAAEVSGLASSDGGGGSPTQPSPPSGSGGQGGSGGTQTGGSGGGGGANGSSTPPGAPSIRSLKLSTSTVSVDAGGHVVSPASPGLSITYTESQAARVTVTLLRSATGVRRGGRCVAPSRRTRKLARCVRFVVISRIVHTDRAGQLTLSLNRLLHRRLMPGLYRLDVTPRAGGKVGKTLSVRFVVRRSRTPHR